MAQQADPADIQRRLAAVLAADVAGHSRGGNPADRVATPSHPTVELLVHLSAVCADHRGCFDQRRYLDWLRLVPVASQCVSDD